MNDSNSQTNTSKEDDPIQNTQPQESVDKDQETKADLKESASLSQMLKSNEVRKKTLSIQELFLKVKEEPKEEEKFLRLISFEEDRTEENIIDLNTYFSKRPNSFFNKYKAENGEHALMMLYNVMRYQFDQKDKNIINYGEFGTKYYITLKGEVSVRVPSKIKRELRFRELLEYLITNDEWIKKNQIYQSVLYEVYK